MINTIWIAHILWICLQVSRNGCGAQSAYTVAAKSLYTALTFGYTATIRPDISVSVSVSFEVSTINELNTRTEEFSVTGWFSLSWEDHFYYWTPATYSNIEYMFLTKDNCWRPQIAINNAVDNLDILKDDMDLMRVKHDKTVLWEPGGVFTIKCAADITYFPFDHQKCSLSLSSLVYSDTEVTLSHYTDKINLEDLEINAEWTVTDTSTETKSHYDGRNAFNKTSLRFTFNLERNYSFYVWTLLVPYILISSLGLVVCILPPMNGEKLTFSTTIIFLVAVYFIIFLTLIAHPTGKFPIVGIYFFFLLIINVLELLMTVAVERMNRNENEERPMSRTVQSRASMFLARLSFYRSGVYNGNTDYEKSHSPIRFPMPKNTRVSPSTLQSATPESQRPRKPDIEFDRIRSAASTRTTSTEVSGASSTMPLHITDTEYSWRDIASMLDRISLAVCLMLVVLSTAIFMTVLLVSMD